LISQSKLTISQKGLVLISVPLIFELVFVVSLVVLLQRADYEAWREAHARMLVTESGRLMVLTNTAVQQLWSYGLFKSPVFHDQYEKTVAEIKDQGELIKRLSLEEPNSKESISRVDEIINNTLTLLGSANDTIELSRRSSSPAGLIYGQAKELEVGFRKLLDDTQQFVNTQRGIEKLDPKAEERARALVMICLAIGVLFNVVLAIILAIFFGRQISKRLNVLVDNTSRLAAEKPLNPLIEGSDEIAHLDHVFHDMAQALAEAAKRRKEVLQMVSHDLRAPLTSTQASLSFVLKSAGEKLEDEVHEEIESAKRNNSRLINLINDFLDYEKMTAGKLVISKVTIELSGIFERSSESVRGLLDQKALTVEISGGRVKANADAERLVQVVVNLLSNAIKYSPHGGTIRLSATESPEQIEVRISDQGPGIPDQYKNLIFESFQQIEDSQGAKKGTTGLGLSICKAIIEEHGGTIGVESQIEAGSTFWFRLPAASGLP